MMYTSQSQKLQRNKHYMNTYRNKESREILLIGVRGTLFLKIKDKEHVGVPFTLATFLYIGNLLAFASFRKKQVSSKDSTVTNT